MMAKDKKVLFDDSENEEDDELHINKAYANKYQEWRLSEELQKYKDRFGDEDLTSESSSDEDFAEVDNPEFDREFLRTMGALHKKIDPKLEGAKFFTGDYSKKREKEKEEEKAMTVKDYERLLITKHSEDQDEEQNVKESAKDMRKRAVDERRSIFEDGLNSDDDGSGDDLLASGLFKVKKPTKSGEQEEEKQMKNQEDPLAFIRGECSSLSNDEDRGLLEGLKEAWSDPKKSTDDKWLIDFFVNERYNEEEDESKLRPYNGVVIDEESISEDEKTLEAMETFETKYRFRFEEPDEEFIKMYPRIIPDSLRTKDERRKLKRVAVKERKQKEKEVKRQEIERLKALKYKEIEAKIEKIKAASGNEDIDLGEKLFEDDFDEAHYDKVMSRTFGEEYYAVDDGNDEKPVFDDDEDIDVIRDYDHWMEKEDVCTFDEENSADWEEDAYDSHHMDNDQTETKKTLQQEMIQASSKKKGRRKSKFAKAIKKKKPVFDPEEKTFESYFDEYYQMDFEDIISGMPCRFKYRKVEPNNFGLSTEEILSAQDKELNRWASLKKMLRYQRDEKEEMKDRKMYQHRASLDHVKHKILPSLFVEDPVEHHITEEEKKKLKNQKRKLRRQQKHMSEMEDTSGFTPEVEAKQSNCKEIESNTGSQCDENTITDKRAMKRKGTKTDKMKSEVVNDTCTEDIKPPKKKKKHKHASQDSQEHNSSMKISPENNINAEERLHSDTKTNVEKNFESQNILNKSKLLETTSGREKKKKKNKHVSSVMPEKIKTKTKKGSPNNTIFQGISDDRLTAYGENPKKIKNKIKYGKRDF